MKTGWFVTVTGYDKKSGNARSSTPIGSGVTAVDLPSGEVVLICIHEATIMNDANTLLSVFQLHEAHVTIDDVAKRHSGKSCIVVDDDLVYPWLSGEL